MCHAFSTGYTRVPLTFHHSPHLCGAPGALAPRALSTTMSEQPREASVSCEAVQEPVEPG